MHYCIMCACNWQDRIMLNLRFHHIQFLQYVRNKWTQRKICLWHTAKVEWGKFQFKILNTETIVSCVYSCDAKNKYLPYSKGAVFITSNNLQKRKWPVMKQSLLGGEWDQMFNISVKTCLQHEYRFSIYIYNISTF